MILTFVKVTKLAKFVVGTIHVIDMLRYTSGSRPFLYRGALLGSWRFHGAPVAERPFCYKIIISWRARVFWVCGSLSEVVF